MGRKKKKATKPKPLAKPEELEPGEIVEEKEIEPGEIVEETDQEDSASDSDHAIPEKLPSAATIQSQPTSSCPPSTSADIRTEDTIGSKENQALETVQPDAAEISENNTDTGSLEQKTTEKQTGSNKNQAPEAIQPDVAVSTENSTEIGSLEDQATVQPDAAETSENNTDTGSLEQQATEKQTGSKENQALETVQSDAAETSENNTDTGSLEQQASEKQTGSNENQAPEAIQPDVAVTTENSTEIGSLEEQATDTIVLNTSEDGCDKKKNPTESTQLPTDNGGKQTTELTQPSTDDGAKANSEANSNLDATITSVIVGNISTDTTKQDLLQLFGLHTTTYLRATVRIKLVNPLRHKFKRYALIKGPKFIMTRLLQCNGWEFNNRKLVIESETNKSKIPFGSRDVQRGEIKQGSFRTSGYNEKGELRPASSASSRQEESFSFTNRMEGPSGNYNPEVVGGGANFIQRDKTMAQTLRQRQNEHQLEEKKKCQLFIEAINNGTGIPPPDAGAVYRALTEELGLSEDPAEQGVKAIYQPDPQNLWKWAVIFVSENLTNKLQGKEITLDINNLTYTFTTKKETKPFFITLHSSPLITDEELRSIFQGFGNVVEIIKKGHNFAKHIDSGVRKIILELEEGVLPRDLPWFVRTSDGVLRKLFFRGKVYLCRKCGTRHTFTERCPTSQNDEEHTSIQQKQTAIPQQQTNNYDTQQKQKTPTSGRNRTDHTQTTQHTPTTTTKPQSNTMANTKDKEGGNENLAGTPTIQEDDFPLSPSLVPPLSHFLPDANARETPLHINREQTIQKKSMEKANSHQKDNQRKQTILIAPRRNPERWKF